MKRSRFTEAQIIGILKEHIMLTTLAYSASLPAIAIGLMYYVSACSGLVY